MVLLKMSGNFSLWIMELGTIAWRHLVMLPAPTTPLCRTFMNQSLTLSRLFKLLVGLILMSSIASLTITSQLRPADYSKISSTLKIFLSFNLTSFSLIVSPGALLYTIFPGPSMCSDCCSRAAIPLQHWPISFLRRELCFALCSPYAMSIQGLPWMIS